MQLVTILVIAAFTILAYLPSFAVPFLFDDFHNILFNESVQPANIAELTDALDARRSRDRPVAMLTFALNYLHAGLDARWYHAVNLAIHLLNAFLLFALVQILARAPLSHASLRNSAVASAFAFAVALIWAVHPVNTQAVTYIVQRMASLAATFYLVGLLAVVLWRSGRIRGHWAAVCFGVAFLCGFGTKANVVTLPVAAVLVDIAFFSGFRRIHAAVLGAIALGTLVLAFIYAGQQLEFLLEPPPHRDFSGLERLLTQGRVLWHYLSLLVWPDAGRLQLDYEFSVSRGVLDPPATLFATAGLATITLAALVWFKRARWLAFGWLFFLLALSVESSILLLELVFEHRLYLPSTLLIAGVLAPLFAISFQHQRLGYLSLTVLMISGLLSWQTMVRNQQWQDIGTFWSGNLERGGSLYRSALNSGLGFLRAGQSDRALEMLSRIESGKGATTPAQRAQVAQLTGEALLQRGDAEHALGEFARAMAATPRWVRPAYFAGIALVQLDRTDEARALLAQMRENHPDSVFTTSLEAEIGYAALSLEEATEIIRSRLRGSSELRAMDRSFLYLHMGNMYRGAGNLQLAKKQYQAALAADPENQAARTSLEQVQMVSRTEQQEGDAQ